MDNNAAEKYLSRVKPFLICDRKDRHQLLARCKDMIHTFQQENPAAEYAGIVAAFGEPSACATDLLSGLETSSVEEAHKKLIFINRKTFTAIIAALVLISLFWYWKYYKSREFDEHSIVVIGPAIEMTEEEYNAMKENPVPDIIPLPDGFFEEFYASRGDTVPEGKD